MRKVKLRRGDEDLCDDALLEDLEDISMVLASAGDAETWEEVIEYEGTVSPFNKTMITARGKDIATVRSTVKELTVSARTMRRLVNAPGLAAALAERYCTRSR